MAFALLTFWHVQFSTYSPHGMGKQELSWNSNNSIVVDLQGYRCRLIWSIIRTSFWHTLILLFFFFHLRYQILAQAVRLCQLVLNSFLKCLSFMAQNARKCSFQHSSFQEFSGGACPRTPPRNDGLKPIVWVLRPQNRLLFTKLRLLKNLYTTLMITTPTVAQDEALNLKNGSFLNRDNFNATNLRF